MKDIRVFVLDDQADAVTRLSLLLQEVEGIVICGSETNPALAIPLIRSLQPDLIFLDVEMPGYSGFDVLKQIGSGFYEPSVIFVTAYDQYAIEAIKASVFDYILKPADPEELQDALAKFRQRRMSVEERDLQGFELLTVREVEVYRLLQQGQRSIEIAGLLNISKNTVDTHRRRILRKLRLSSTSEILLQAARGGLTRRDNT